MVKFYIFVTLMESTVYLLSNLEARIDLIEAGDINQLKWDHDASNFQSWLDQIVIWDPAELKIRLNLLLDKVNQLLTLDNIIINKIQDPADFFSDPEEVSPALVHRYNLRRRDELTSYKLFLSKGIELINQSTENTVIDDNEFVSSKFGYLEIIEKELLPFKTKNNISESNYDALVTALNNGFKSQKFTDLEKMVMISGIKATDKLGVPLKRIYMDCSPVKKLSFEYLQFAKRNISLFSDVELSKEKFTSCAMYRCFTKSQ